MKNKINRALVAKKKSYIYPHTEVITISGPAVMLGASGDIHSGNTSTNSQTINRMPVFCPKDFYSPM